MTALAQVNKYLTNHYQGMEPEQLILLLFKGALDRIELTRQGILEKDIQKRGENLSRVIAIISELNASLDPQMNDEGTRFLRGLYTAILAELPKVSVSNSLTTLDRTEKYIVQLKKIWETNVMGHVPGSATGEKNVTPVPPRNIKPVNGYGQGGFGKSFNAISV